ncbi:MAG: cytochrome c oxidase subunit 3 family protein [Salinibacter sp.]
MATETAPAPADTDVEQDHHPEHLEHHFVSSEQQFDSAKLGMWVFLITEVLLFSGMFVAYAVYRQWHPETFAAASHTLNQMWGTINTLVLLTSSLTVALAIHYVKQDKVKQCVYYLLGTLGLAGVFMVIKYVEYSTKFAHGVFPGAAFDPHGEHYAHLAGMDAAPQFFSLYFVMTGIHGLHVVIGMLVIGTIAFMAWRGSFSSEWYTPVELTGLYWHLVDIVWIFLYPLLYLI